MKNEVKSQKNQYITEFTDSILRGYGQIFLSNNPLSGFCFFIGSFFIFYNGYLGLWAGVLATLTAYILKTDRELIKSGVFGCNGILIGLALSSFLKTNFFSLLLVITVSAFLSTTLLNILLSLITRNFHIPILSVPFVIISWMGMFLSKELPLSVKTSFLQKPLPFMVYIEYFISNIIPEWTKYFFISLSSVMFQKSILFGLLCITGILLHSRITAFMAIIGYTAGTFFLYIIGAPLEKIYSSDAGFNYILISMALGGFFILLNKQSLLYTLFGVITGALMSIASIELLNFFNLPILAAPFNIVTIFFLLALRYGLNGELLSLYILPLYEVKNPEKSLEIYKERHVMTRIKKINLSLPFTGYWYVSQGNDDVETHKDEGKYGWDFIALGEDGLSFQNEGKNIEDYYTFGLPVFSPASGTVVKVINHIPDNKPHEKNKEHPWGNYIIIRHDYDIFSEISHFKEGSILIAENQQVETGQILGYCGNSGYSPEPHIHYQLQCAPITGYMTYPCKFSFYVKKNNNTRILIIQGVPDKGDIISNYEPEESLSLIPYLDFNKSSNKTYTIKIKDRTFTENWKINYIDKEKISEVFINGRKKDLKKIRFNRKLIFLPEENSNELNGFYYCTIGLGVIPVFYKNNFYWHNHIIKTGSIKIPGFYHKQLCENRIESREEITADGKSLDCIQIVTDFINIKSNKKEGTRRLWIAKNTGILKVIFEEKKKKVEINLQI